MNRMRSVAALAAIVILAACGPADSSNSGQPSSEASVAASEAQSSGGIGFLPSFTAGAAADLEALIPDMVGGLTMQKESMAGSEYLVSPGSDADTIKFIEDLGVSPSDISIAVGFGFSTDASSNLVMFVFRAAGADTDQLISVFKTATDADRTTPLTWTTTEVAGKQVEVSTENDANIYLYAKDDVLVFISGDAASTEEAIGGLP